MNIWSYYYFLGAEDAGPTEEPVLVVGWKERQPRNGQRQKPNIRKLVLVNWEHTPGRSTDGASGQSAGGLSRLSRKHCLQFRGRLSAQIVETTITGGQGSGSGLVIGQGSPLGVWRRVVVYRKPFPGNQREPSICAFRTLVKPNTGR